MHETSYGVASTMCASPCEAKLEKLFVNYQSLRCSNIPFLSTSCVKVFKVHWKKSFHANPSGPGFMRDGTTKSRAPFWRFDRIIKSNKAQCLPNKAPCLGRDMGTPLALHGDPARTPANQLRYINEYCGCIMYEPCPPNNSAFLHLFSYHFQF